MAVFYGGFPFFTRCRIILAITREIRYNVCLMFDANEGILMNPVVIITDSNSGMTPDEAKALGVGLIPMPFYIDEQLYYEGVSLSQEEFMRGWRTITRSRPLSPRPPICCFYGTKP